MIKKLLLTAVLTMMASTCMAAWQPLASGNGVNLFYDDQSFAYAYVKQQDGSFNLDKNLISVDHASTMPKAQAAAIAERLKKPEFKNVTQMVSRVFFFQNKENLIVPLVTYRDANGKIILKEGSPQVWDYKSNANMKKLAGIVKSYAKSHDKEMTARAKASVKK